MFKANANCPLDNSAGTDCPQGNYGCAPALSSAAMPCHRMHHYLCLRQNTASEKPNMFCPCILAKYVPLHLMRLHLLLCYGRYTQHNVPVSWLVRAGTSERHAVT